MSKDPLTISDVNEKHSIKFQVNPAKMEKRLAINYNLSAPLGSIGSDANYIRHEPELLKFETIFDGTGVLEDSKSVNKQMDDLDKIVYCYDGNKHEPNIVVVRWGKESFKGKLSCLNRKFTLYTTDGTPLRAELEFEFVSFISASEQAHRSNRSSPDLTHVIQVKAGDTLPALCLKIYRDSNYYMQIARINKLKNFRQLVPGTELIFPPLKHH